MDERPATTAAELSADPPQTEPEVSILITAHNAEETIQGCLRAIKAQDFPMERVEVILVDDRSTDATALRAQEIGIKSLRVLRIDAPHPALTARQAAIDLGMREARGEIVLLADADGRVPREWIHDLTGHLSFRDGAVAGPVIFGGAHPIIARYQSIESLITFTLYRLFERHKIATGLMAANVAVRRTAYLESGGFGAGGFSAHEGVALAAVLQKGGWSLRYLTEPLVQTMDAGSLVRLVQRSRRKLRSAAPMINTLWITLIATNMLLLGWAALGSHFNTAMLILVLRYGLGLFVFATSLGQYRRYPSLPSLLVFEPMLTFVGFCASLSLVVKPRWRWGDVQYTRTGPEVSLASGNQP